MQRAIALALTAIFIIAGGAFLIMNDKSTNTAWPADDPKGKAKIATSSSGGGSNGGSSGSSASGGNGSTSAVPDQLHDKSTQTSTDPSASSTDKAAQGDNATKQTTISSGTSGNTNTASGQSQERRATPIKAAPVNTSPPPPASQKTTGIVYGETLSYMKSGQAVIGAPRNTTTYPVIPNGTAYQGTIGSPGNLSQADISQLASYPSPGVIEYPPPATRKEGHNDASGKTIWTDVPFNPINIPVGSYATSGIFKQTVDSYIANMGPHLQRKLNTTEWSFTPAPMASYESSYNAHLWGRTRIRGKLKVRYSDANNSLNLDPGVWYQGDAEIGMESVAFFSHDAPRYILMSLVILGHWGKV